MHTNSYTGPRLEQMSTKMKQNREFAGTFKIWILLIFGLLEGIMVCFSKTVKILEKSEKNRSAVGDLKNMQIFS